MTRESPLILPLFEPPCTLHAHVRGIPDQPTNYSHWLAGLLGGGGQVTSRAVTKIFSHLQSKFKIRVGLTVLSLLATVYLKKMHN